MILFGKHLQETSVFDGKNHRFRKKMWNKQPSSIS